MGPMNLSQFHEKLAAQHPDRRLAELDQLWKTFGLRYAFVESAGTNAFSAVVVGDLGAGSLKEVGGMISLSLAPYRAVTATGIKERPESTQLSLCLGEKELHLAWPGPLATTLEDETFLWLVARLHSPVGILEAGHVG